MLGEGLLPWPHVSSIVVGNGRYLRLYILLAILYGWLCFVTGKSGCYKDIRN